MLSPLDPIFFRTDCERIFHRRKQQHHLCFSDLQFRPGLLMNMNYTSPDRLCAPNYRSSFFIVQSICIGFFTVEFLLRIISCPSFLQFIQSFLNWIDFLSIGKHSPNVSSDQCESRFLSLLAPYFIILAINLFGFYTRISVEAYYALNVLRLFRFVRVFKFYRIFQHVKALRVLASTFQESIPDFLILLSFLSLSGFLFGAAIYFAENDINGSAFDSIPKATYYGIITLTAVG